MSDIFISYSRKDSEQALALADRLRGEGMSVWIDQQGIEAAKTWSEEIVNAIEGSKAFVVLLSSHSVESLNVAKELSIAFESEKVLLPVALEDVVLSSKFKYPLAGVQRVAYQEFSALVSALLSAGIAPAAMTESKQDPRKSLLVMPFEDLSPTQDNLWFADGLAGELIDKLSHLNALRLIDRKTSRDLRNATLTLYEIADTLNVQFVVEGSVRKFGDQIKISTSVLHVSSGDHLWQESFRGEMHDIFDLQEAVAERVVAALEIHLPGAERRELARKSTSNAKAYEVWLQAQEALWSNVSKEMLERAILLYGEAVRIDPQMSKAWGNIAVTHLQIYRFYDPSDTRLRLARQAIDEVGKLEGESAQWYWLQSTLALRANDPSLAVSHARSAIRIDPRYSLGYNILGFALRASGDLRGAIEAFDQELRIVDDLNSQFVLLITLADLNETETLKHRALLAMPRWKIHLKLSPDDLYKSVQYAVICFWAGEIEAARSEADRLCQVPNIDALNLNNLASLYEMMGDYERAIAVTRMSIARGYRNVETLKRYAAPMSEMPEFQAVIAELEAMLTTNDHGS